MCKKMSSRGGAFLTNNFIRSANSLNERKINTGKNSINNTSFCCIFLVGDINE